MNKVKVTTDIVYNENCSKELTLIHFSDVHFNAYTKPQVLSKVKNSIASINPDYIIITGDLIDSPEITKNKEKTQELITFLKDIAKISKVIISLGNHDITMAYDLEFFNNLNKLKNIYVLNDESYIDEFIHATGFTVPINYYYNISYKESIPVMTYYLDNHKDLWHNLDNKHLNIALIHSPIKLTDSEIKNRLKDYDLILCGHTHDGMVPECIKFLFPKNAGIISPYKDFFPKIARGKIEQTTENKNQTIIISGGITKLSLRSAKSLRKLNFVYNSGVNKILIKKKRGEK